MKRNKTKDLLALEHAFFIHCRRHYDGEYGSIGLDSKRPFGNSYVQGDILDIIEFPHKDEYSDEEIEYADNLFNELPKFLHEQYLSRMAETV